MCDAVNIVFDFNSKVMHGVAGGAVGHRFLVYKFGKEVLLPPAIEPDPLYAMAIDPANLLNCWKGQECKGRGIDRSHQKYYL